MNTFQIKTVCAVLLWAVSLTFGVLLPYFLWKITPKSRQRTNIVEETSETEEECIEESEVLIVRHQRQSSQNESRGCILWTKRAAAYLRVKFTSGKFSSIIYCLCGGVFLGVSLLDLIPQSRSAVKVVLDASQTDTNYPVAEFMITLGLLLVMVVENLVSEAVLSEVPHNNAHRHSTSEAQESTDSEGASERRRSRSRIHNVTDNVSSYRMYILVVTLSLHSVFEGLAIGLQKDITTLVQLVIAVTVHKAVLTFGVGLPLFETLGRVGKVKTACFCALIFCSASPVGCFAGAFVSGDSFNSSLAALFASAILQCLATGTFLYVTFVEVIPREFSHHSKKHNHEGMERTQNNPQNAQSTDYDYRVQEHGIASQNKSKRHSQLIKLVALVVGFAIASGLQFL